VVFITSVLVAVGMQESRDVVFGLPAYHVDTQAFESARVTAEVWVVFDAESGEVLGGKNIDTRLPIASVTKLITAETALNTIKNLDATTTVSWKAVSTEGTSGKLVESEKIKVRELLFPMLLESSNDASEVLAEHAKRDVFLKRMNDRVQELGMANTSLVDPSGLSVRNISTGGDLKILLQYLQLHHKHILDITRLASFVGATHVWQNNDPVYVTGGFVGGKQGFTEEAGRTFGGIFEEHFSTDIVRPVGVVILGSRSLASDISTLRAALHDHVTYAYTVK
jgi:D-alanyl-D-alanine carboxypeptidase